jgi:hypothetical protein
MYILLHLYPSHKYITAETKYHNGMQKWVGYVDGQFFLLFLTYCDLLGHFHPRLPKNGIQYFTLCWSKLQFVIFMHLECLDILYIFPYLRYFYSHIKKFILHKMEKIILFFLYFYFQQLRYFCMDFILTCVLQIHISINKIFTIKSNYRNLHKISSVGFCTRYTIHSVTFFRLPLNNISL